MEDITKEILHIITFTIGLVGIFIIIVGTIDGLFQFLRKQGFAKVRYIIGKHILLGLDFLVVKDVIETVLLKGSEAHLMDLALLITIVAIRIALTTHMSKGVQEMRMEMAKAKKHSEKIEDELHHVESEGDELERKICELKEADIESTEKRKILEDKIEELSRILKNNKK